MSALMIALTSVSLVGLLAISISRFVRARNRLRFLIQFLIIGACFGGLYFFFWARHVTARGANDVYFVIVLYLFMLLGIIAQYLYTYLTQPKRKRKAFDFGLFIAPVFASPIVFIPLLAALQNAQIDLRDLNTARLMVFFVAFENGFFWKEYFDHRRKEKEESDNET